MPKKNEPMNLRQWWDHVGTENVERVVEALGRSMKTFAQMRYGNKRPSGSLALEIVEKAKLITPGYVPDLALLIAGVPKSATPRVAGKIPPSPQFMRSRSRNAREAALQ